MQAMEAARDHLKPGGVFAMYNYYREDWLVDRLAGTLAPVYGHGALRRLGRRGGAPGGPHGRARSDDLPGGATWTATDAAAAASPATDDYPFLYLCTALIPRSTWSRWLLILAASLVAVRVVAGPLRPWPATSTCSSWARPSCCSRPRAWSSSRCCSAPPGSSTRSSSRASWWRCWPRSRWRGGGGCRAPAYLYAALLAALAVAWVVPVDALLGLELLPRFVLAVVIWFTPIFIANLVFAERFRRVGARMWRSGPTCSARWSGGVLEYVALLTGYQALLLLVAVLYGGPSWRGACTWARRARHGSPSSCAGARGYAVVVIATARDGLNRVTLLISTGDVKKGVIIELDGQLMKVLDWTHIKMARGSAQVRMKLQNVRKGDIVERTFQAGTRWPRARVDQRKVKYLYSDGDAYTSWTTRRTTSSRSAGDAGDDARFLKENTEAFVTIYEARCWASTCR